MDFQSGRREGEMEGGKEKGRKGGVRQEGEGKGREGEREFIVYIF